MRINRKLNLVVPIERGENDTIYVHSTPLMRETFERYFLIIGKVHSQIITQAANVISGPKMAALMLKRVAQADGVWEGADGVKDGLMAEIDRQSSVIVPTPSGWRSVPLTVALDQGMIDADDFAEAEGKIVFFIVASAMFDRQDLPIILDGERGMTKLWHCQVSSLNSTEFATSLPTSTPGENTGEKATASSIPH